MDSNSFSIGRNNCVTFYNGSCATLNRVTGGPPFAILGKVAATGNLYVVNPHGIVVAPSGVISTGGRFVASARSARRGRFARSAVRRGRHRARRSGRG
ncbi:filamentous hemagglutinin N-terminal domain-containing protein [Paraburkholderia sp. EG304]|uniref:two-partner secretion domain-containing protein n=1 Tax=Paraburkholderia sp. EG304 TaxID=3237015 RepID=UPI00397B1253